MPPVFGQVGEDDIHRFDGCGLRRQRSISGALQPPDPYSRTEIEQSSRHGGSWNSVDHGAVISWEPIRAFDARHRPSGWSTRRDDMAREDPEPSDTTEGECGLGGRDGVRPSREHCRHQTLSLGLGGTGESEDLLVDRNPDAAVDAAGDERSSMTGLERLASSERCVLVSDHLVEIGLHGPKRISRVRHSDSATGRHPIGRRSHARFALFLTRIARAKEFGGDGCDGWGEDGRVRTGR